MLFVVIILIFSVNELVWVVIAAYLGVDLVNQFSYMFLLCFCFVIFTRLGKHTNILGGMCNPSKLVIYY